MTQLPPSTLKAIIHASAFPLGVFLLNFVCLLTGGYDLFPWLDIPFHFLGGVVMAHALAVYFWLLFPKQLKESWLLYALLVISATTTVAVGWECAEFLADTFFGGHHQLSIFDTMKDQFLGGSGATVYALFAIVIPYEKHK